MIKKLCKKIISSYRQDGILKTFCKVGKKLLHRSNVTDAIIFDYEQDQINKKDMYQLWQKKHARTAAQLESQKKAVFNRMPLISIVIPTYNTKVHYFKELLASIKMQTYANWELCIADGNSTNKDTIAYLQECARQDKRIRIKFLSENLGISGNTNEAIKLAKGEYIAFADHDDILENDALYEVVKTVNSTDADLIYTDEDKVNEDSSIFYEPHIKPAYSPDKLSSCNYFCHLVVVSTRILDKAGLLDSRFDGSQDHELVLRICDYTNKIVHIPRILYHWRQFGASMSKQNITLCQQRGRQAVAEHLQRKGRLGEVVQEFSYRVKYAVKQELVSIISIVHSDIELSLTNAREVLKNTDYKNIEIILVNMGSQYAGDINDKNIKIIKYTSTSDYAARNFAVRQAQGKYLLFLADKIKPLVSDWLTELTGHAQYEESGAVSSKLLTPDMERIFATNYIVQQNPQRQFSGQNIKTIGLSALEHITRDVSAVLIDLFMIKRQLFIEFQGFDESFYHDCADIKMCLDLLNAGKNNIYSPYAPCCLYQIEKKNRADYKLFAQMLPAGFSDKYNHINYEEQVKGDLNNA